VREALLMDYDNRVPIFHERPQSNDVSPFEAPRYCSAGSLMPGRASSRWSQHLVDLQQETFDFLTLVRTGLFLQPFNKLLL
jgi:hypothetical protein